MKSAAMTMPMIPLQLKIRDLLNQKFVVVAALSARNPFYRRPRMGW